MGPGTAVLTIDLQQGLIASPTTTAPCLSWRSSGRASPRCRPPRSRSTQLSSAASSRTRPIAWYRGWPGGRCAADPNADWAR